MLGKNSKSRLFFFATLAVGGIGACGQAYLLYHELVDCLPYKELDSDFYQAIAEIGVCFAPFVATAIGFLFGVKRFWLATIIPVSACPLLFGLVFKVASVLQRTSAGVKSDTGFDYFTPAVAAQHFYFNIFSLAITGLIIGAICIFLLSWLAKEKNLA